MKYLENKNPGGVRQHTVGADVGNSVDPKFRHHQYPNRMQMQSRRLRRRFGLSACRAALVASLHFGEDC